MFFILKRLEDLEKATSINTEFRISEMIRLIIKNAKKVEKDPDDIKIDDVVLALSYEELIPEEYKSEEVVTSLGALKEWFENNQ